MTLREQRSVHALRVRKEDMSLTYQAGWHRRMFVLSQQIFILRDGAVFVCPPFSQGKRRVKP